MKHLIYHGQKLDMEIELVREKTRRAIEGWWGGVDERLEVERFWRINCVLLTSMLLSASPRAQHPYISYLIISSFCIRSSYRSIRRREEELYDGEWSALLNDDFYWLLRGYIPSIICLLKRKHVVLLLLSENYINRTISCRPFSA